MSFPDEPTTDPVMSLPVAPLTYFNFLSRSPDPFLNGRDDPPSAGFTVD